MTDMKSEFRDYQDAFTWAEKRRDEGLKVVLTNGCFDVIHRGHIDLLEKAAGLGDVLVIALNADESVRRIKGKERPFMPAPDRAAILLALRWVDRVLVFEEDTPEKVIEGIKPDVLVKGAEYEEAEIVGAEFVRAYGGRVERIPMVEGESSSSYIEKLRNSAAVEGHNSTEEER